MLETPNPTMSANIQPSIWVRFIKNDVSDETMVFSRPLVISCLAFPDNRLMVSSPHVQLKSTYIDFREIRSTT